MSVGKVWVSLHGTEASSFLGRCRVEVGGAVLHLAGIQGSGFLPFCGCTIFKGPIILCIQLVKEK